VIRTTNENGTSSMYRNARSWERTALPRQSWGGEPFRSGAFVCVRRQGVPEAGQPTSHPGSLFEVITDCRFVPRRGAAEPLRRRRPVHTSGHQCRSKFLGPSTYRFNLCALARWATYRFYSTTTGEWPPKHSISHPR